MPIGRTALLRTYLPWQQALLYPGKNDRSERELKAFEEGKAPAQLTLSSAKSHNRRMYFNQHHADMNML
jgi:hypothetical protein